MTTAAAPDAIALLRADHAAVGYLFAEYAGTHSVSDKKALVAEICAALRLHAQIEGDVFYPAVASALAGSPRASEAGDGHADALDIIGELEGSDPDAKVDDAKVRRLALHVKQHARMAQNVTFPRVKASSLDLVEIGARMNKRKAELLERKA